MPDNEMLAENRTKPSSFLESAIASWYRSDDGLCLTIVESRTRASSITTLECQKSGI